MLNQQFFNRAQLTKILCFKSVSMLQSLENKGFIKPDVKPSRYSLNQVLFMMICKEIIDFTKLSWKDLINISFNQILKYDLIKNNLLFVSQDTLNGTVIYDAINDINLGQILERFLDVYILDEFSTIDGRENSTYEDVPSFITKLDNTHEYNSHEDIPSFMIKPAKNGEVTIISIDRINRKLHNKCIELKIDLKEKIQA
jgi:hypothetical protein